MLNIRSLRLKTPALLMATMTLLVAGCDDGKIYPDNSEMESSGFSVTMKGVLTGCGQYHDTQYIVALAAFETDNEFAIVSKNLSDGADDVTITNIDPNAATIEICILSRLRKRVMTLASLSVETTTGTDVIFNVGELNAAPFAAISSDIFTKTCLQCHGGTETPAAGLDLNASKAYADIVSIPSKVVENELIVDPGNASASTLWQAVATDISESWRFDHSNLLTTDKSSFIESWINNGAHD